MRRVEPAVIHLDPRGRIFLGRQPEVGEVVAGGAGTVERDDVEGQLVFCHQVVDLAHVVLVSARDHDAHAEGNVGVLDLPNGFDDLCIAAAAPMIDAVGVVQVGRSIDADADAEAGKAEEFKPAVIDQRAIGLDRVLAAHALAVARLILHGTLVERPLGQHRLAAVPNEGDDAIMLELPDIGEGLLDRPMQYLIPHDRVSHVIVVAVLARQIAKVRRLDDVREVHEPFLYATLRSLPAKGPAAVMAPLWMRLARRSIPNQ